MKNFNGKAIYNPSGKAGEYSYWACNFYVGCSNGCTYCYLKKGVLENTMGGDKPKLKSCFKDENHALEVFEKELKANLPELQKHGLFFSFTTDPMLPETIFLTTQAASICVKNDVLVKILTKVDFVKGLDAEKILNEKEKKYIAFGFTLTGHDELEPNASTNAERIEAMRKLHEAGFKTWASVEPVIDFKSSIQMIINTMSFCDLYKIGLESGKKYPKRHIWQEARKIFIQLGYHSNAKIYFKDSLLKQAGIKREELPSNCVGRDYDI